MTARSEWDPNNEQSLYRIVPKNDLDPRVIMANWGIPDDMTEADFFRESISYRSDIPTPQIPERPPALKEPEYVQFLVQAMRGVAEIQLQDQEPVAQGPDWIDQDTILESTLGDKFYDDSFMNEIIPGPVTMDLPRIRLLREYTTMRMSRSFAERERGIMRGGKTDKLQFYVHDAGWEYLFRCMAAAEISLALSDQNGNLRAAENQVAQNPLYLHYRTQTAAMLRGVDPRTMVAQNTHATGDIMAGGKVLAAHVAFEKGSIPPITSDTGPHLYHAKGTAVAIEERRRSENSSGYGRFSQKDAVTTAVTGEATMAGQDQAIGAVQQALYADWHFKENWKKQWISKNPDKPVEDMPDPEGIGLIFVVGNNNAGISMGLSSSSIARDPIQMYRNNPFIKLIEVDADDVEGMAQAAIDAQTHAKKRRGVVMLHVRELPAITDHTSSSDRSLYFKKSEHEKHLARDPLAAYKQYLVDNNIIDEETLNAIDSKTHKLIMDIYEKGLTIDQENPETLHNHVYPDQIKFAKELVSRHQPPIERIRVPRAEGVIYLDYHNLRDGPQLTYWQQVNAAWGRILAEDPRFIYYGEDVGTFNKGADLRDLAQARLLEAEASNKFSPAELQAARLALQNVLNKHPLDADPEGMALLSAAIMKGKGGVFGTSRHLELLFGSHRVFNNPITEADLVGSGIGRALTKGKGEFAKGQIPIIQIQFGPYIYPAAEQLLHALTENWRSNGQYPCGMIIEVQDMGDIGSTSDPRDRGGVGGIGHGNAFISEFSRAGGVIFAPANGMEAAGMQLEAARLARIGVPVLIYHPISRMRADVTPYQGDTHVPVGEARIIKPDTNIIRPQAADENILIVTHSNNVWKAEAAAAQLAEENIYVTIADTRGNIGRQFDYERILPEMQKAGKVIVIDKGPGHDAQGYLESLNHGWDYLRAPVVMLHGADTPFPAGRQFEKEATPQYEDIILESRKLAAWN